LRGSSQNRRRFASASHVYLVKTVTVAEPRLALPFHEDCDCEEPLFFHPHSWQILDGSSLADVNKFEWRIPYTSTNSPVLMENYYTLWPLWVRVRIIFGELAIARISSSEPRKFNPHNSLAMLAAQFQPLRFYSPNPRRVHIPLSLSFLRSP
jgi:hypothetical protein